MKKESESVVDKTKNSEIQAKEDHDEEEVDIDIVEELKTDRNELDNLEIVMISIFLVVIISSTVVLSFSPTVRNYVTHPLIHQDELNFTNWLYIASFSILLGSVGFPMTLLNFMLGSLMKNFLIALSLAFVSNAGASLVIFCIGRYFLAERLKILFKENPFYQTLQYAVRKNPLKFAILFKMLLVPHVVKNYALAITDIKFSYFLIATIVANSFLALVWATLGHSVRGVVEAVTVQEKQEGVNWLLVTRVGLIVLSLGITIYLFFYGRSIYKEMETKKRICTRRKSCQIDKLHLYNPRPSIMQQYMTDPLLGTNSEEKANVKE